MEDVVTKIEINCDMGEGFGRWTMGCDEELIKSVDVVNIACGFHAGDPTIMRNTVKLAKEHRVKIGAHPGLQDLIGFGRRKMEIHPDDMYSMILYQVGALEGILRAEGIPLNHIKPHGELFFYMQRDLKIMNAVLRACSVFKVPVYGAKGADEQKAMCESLGLIFVEEAYVDLQYDKNKRLLSFAQSKVATPKDVYARTLSIGMDDVVTNNEGSVIELGFHGRPFSFCIHSDIPTAVENVEGCRKAVNIINEKRGWK